MTSRGAGRICGVLGVLASLWFWVCWITEPHMTGFLLAKPGPALGLELAAIPLSLLAARLSSKWFYSITVIAGATMLFVGLRLH